MIEAAAVGAAARVAVLAPEVGEVTRVEEALASLSTTPTLRFETT